MGNLNGFDATDVAPSAPMEMLPAGRYIVTITGSEMKSTASGDGEYLALELTIADGPHVNRKLWSNLNLRNPNEKAEQIARQDLSAICHAVGVLKVNDSQELHGKPFAVTVAIQPAREKNGTQYEARNVVKGYMSAELAAAGQPGTVKPAFGAAANTGTPAGAKSTPWGKRA